MVTVVYMKHIKFKQLFVSIEYKIYIADGYGSNKKWVLNEYDFWESEMVGWDGLVGELVKG